MSVWRTVLAVNLGEVVERRSGYEMRVRQRKDGK